MNGLDILINEYINQGLSIEKLKEYIRMEISKNNLSEDVKSHIMTFVNPSEPKIVDSLEDLYKIRNRKRRHDEALNLILKHPELPVTRDIARRLIISGILYLDDVLDLILANKARFKDSQVPSLIWYLLVKDYRFQDAENLMKIFPNMTLDWMVNTSGRVNVLQGETDPFMIRFISIHPTILSNISWNKLFREGKWAKDEAYQKMFNYLTYNNKPIETILPGFSYEKFMENFHNYKI